MKLVTIQPVPEPKSFADVKFTQGEHKEAVKAGPKVVPYPTAMEALANSKGLYEVKKEVRTVELEIKGMKAPEEMSNAELSMELQMHGKPLRKQLSRSKVIEFVKTLREKAADMITDDDEE
jgi:hypothetical protein